MFYENTYKYNVKDLELNYIYTDKKNKTKKLSFNDTTFEYWINTSCQNERWNRTGHRVLIWVGLGSLSKAAPS